jgi:hypothetical protein
LQEGLGQDVWGNGQATWLLSLDKLAKLHTKCGNWPHQQ